VNKDKKPLSETHPELAKEAYGWDPNDYSKGSNKKLEWKCNKNHVWTAIVSSRTRAKNGCPFCGHQKCLTGFNDMATTHPELAFQAFGWDPKNYIAGTNKKLFWKCKQGHTWEATGNHRVNGKGCPYCKNSKCLSGFNDMATTHPHLAKEAVGVDPTKIIAGTQKSISWVCLNNHSFIMRGSHRVQGHGCPYCSNYKVFSGFNDLETTYPSIAKEAYGWDPKKIIAGSHKKMNWKCQKNHVWNTSPINRVLNKSGCHYCTNQIVLMGFNDLATTHPELAKEADGWDPSQIIGGSSKKLGWKCKFGHKWKTAPYQRTLSETNCPFCSNRKVLKGFNDLATTHPAIAKEASGWDPQNIVANHAKKLLWKCENNHTWKTSANHRMRGSGCPSCAPSGFDPNKNAFIYFLIQSKWELYQIGITNSPEDRLKSHKKNGFDLLELRGPMDGHTAQEVETAMLRYLKSQKADLSPDHVAGKFDGYSESWTIDSFQVNNLKELIDKASEAGY